MTKTAREILQRLIIAESSSVYKELANIRGMLPIDQALSALRALIKEERPKDIYGTGFGKKSYNQGQNEALKNYDSVVDKIFE